jgi:DNA mismatch endonuclease, patch repair protein
MDMFTKERRSEIMGRIKGKNTAPELKVRKLLHRLGFRFRLHRADLPGKPDVVLTRLRTVVFVHGCFWHGHDCKRGSAHRKPKSNTDYWYAKLNRNRERDARLAAEYDLLGWKRIVVWACETENLESLEARLLRELSEKPRA